MSAQCGNCRNSLSHFYRKKNRERNGFTIQRNYQIVDLTKFFFCSEREFLVFPHCDTAQCENYGNSLLAIIM